MSINGLKYTIKDLLNNTQIINIPIEHINNGWDCISSHGIAEEILKIEVY